MNKNRLTATLLALALVGSQTAMAQGNSQHNGHSGRGQGHEDRGDRNDRNERGERDGGRGGPGHGEPGWQGRGAGPEHNFYRGGRLSNEYRNRSYVIDDWRRHHLSAPPRGYNWVQTGADYVLVAVATGLILNILLSQ